ncbi:uncharacterized protein BJ171DRAFT_498568 [Polychytrium aggregatum]|uniref:uncharacterized protein n=1 Tax=Polychytrium aggregatum TaxID=110093 RepID=UPI0022FF0A79|nr:uncharacterized protein BJ171DRAFT_498568 [Polychytrium aggregatum]KAI9206065.1 hypothetical protein BJ171DRAFT_498568 [Polychytrium aggregatum]
MDFTPLKSSKRNADAKSLVAKAKEEREKREQARLEAQQANTRQAAARTILRSLVRLRRQRTCTAELRSDWDQRTRFRVLDEHPLPAGTAASSPPKDAGEPLLHIELDLDGLPPAAGLLVRFYEPEQDQLRLLALCRALLAHSPTKVAQQLCSCAVPLMGRLLQICARQVIQAKADGRLVRAFNDLTAVPNMDLYLTGPELRFMIVFMDVKVLGPHSAGVFRYLRGSDFYEIIAVGLEVRIQKLVHIGSLKKRLDIHTAVVKKLNLWVNGMVHILSLSLLASNSPAPSMEKAPDQSPDGSTRPHDEPEHGPTLFISRFMTIPLLISAIDPTAVTLLSKSLLLDKITATLASHTGRRQVLAEVAGSESVVFLTANLSALYHRAPGPSSASRVEGRPERHSDFVRSVLYILQQGLEPSGVLPSNRKYHPILKWTQARSIKTYSPECYQRLGDDLALLWRRSFVATSFAAVLDVKAASASATSTPAQSPRGSVTEQTLATIAVHDACELFLALTRTIQAFKPSIMSSLSFHPGLVPGLWRFLAATTVPSSLFGGSRDRLHILLDAVGAEPAKEPLMPILELFCEGMYLIFLTLDEEEIYQTERPFRLQELSKISLFLNHFCYQLFWNQSRVARISAPSDSTTVQEQQQPDVIELHGALAQSISILDPALKLLTLLHTRSARRAFGEETDMWGIVKSSSNPWKRSTGTITAKDFVRDVRAGDRRCTLILANQPWCLSFASRVEIFRSYIEADKALYQSSGSTRIVIHRERVLEDGFTQLGPLAGHQFKQTIHVKFVNRLGLQEAGIDRSGVFKEFLEDLASKCFEPNLNLFKSTPDGTVVPSATSFVQENHLELLEFVGRVFGKALYEGITLDIPFADFIYSKLLGMYNFLDELPSLDPQLYKNLTSLRHYEGDCADFGLNFTIDLDVFGKVVTRELKPGGTHISVTNDNVHEYIYLTADYRLNQECRDQYRAFIEGFRKIIPEAWLKLFSPTELRVLMSGEDSLFDVGELRRYTRYEGGYFDQHKAIRMFWQVLDEFDAADRSKFLKFVTSCSKPPVGGFQHLHPAFTIRMVAVSAGDNGQAETEIVPVMSQMLGSVFGLGKDSKRLPTSATCFNVLKLPAYVKKSTLRDRLRYAINAGAGFELS